MEGILVFFLPFINGGHGCLFESFYISLSVFSFYHVSNLCFCTERSYIRSLKIKNKDDLKKLRSIDAQFKLLVPGKVREDDKLFNRFLDTSKFAWRGSQGYSA
jgi:hypothetical protein